MTPEAVSTSGTVGEELSPTRDGDLAESTGSQEPVLQVAGISKSFSGLHAVRDASFEAPPGEITGLIGPNGAGKSTVAGLVGGSLRPDCGEIRFKGKDITNLPPYRRARLGLIRTYQLSSEFRRLTVLENMLAGAQGQRGERFRVLVLGRRSWASEQERLVATARELLDRFGLLTKENEFAGELSGGERRILELARALMASPELLLLDEPMAGVNPTFALTIERHLLEVRSEGVSMLIIEHELDVLDRLCSSVVVMARGAVIASGKMADLRADSEVRNAYLIG